MSLLIPIQYGNRSYPGGITSTIKEVAGHFDVPEIPLLRCQYSLHTEYSYGRRQLNSTTVVRYPEIVRASARGIPRLWWSKEWAEEFSSFLGELTASVVRRK
jgi:hypothetical protein